MRHYRSMVAAAMLTGASLEQAEDAAQDAFEAALKHLSEGNTIRNPPGWLCTVAVRCYLRPPSSKRRLGKVIENSVEEFTDDQLLAIHLRTSDDPIELSTQLMLVRDVLQTLPETDRVLITANMYDLSWVETAGLLGPEWDDQRVRGRVKHLRSVCKSRFADLRSNYKGERST